MRCIILSPKDELQLGDWKPLTFNNEEPTDSTTMRDAERTHIINVLERTNWRIRGNGGAAEVLNLKPTTLASKMKKLGIVNQKTLGSMESE